MKGAFVYGAGFEGLHLCEILKFNEIEVYGILDGNSELCVGIG